MSTNRKLITRKQQRSKNLVTGMSEEGFLVARPLSLISRHS